MRMLRPTFAAGQLLDADHLQLLVTYFEAHVRLHNLHCFGVGIHDGLRVTEDEKHRLTLHVTVGFAVDDLGRPISIDEPVTLLVPRGFDGFVVAGVEERPMPPVAVAVVEPDPRERRGRREVHHEAAVPPRVDEIVPVVRVAATVPEHFLTVAAIIGGRAIPDRDTAPAFRRNRH